MTLKIPFALAVLTTVPFVAPAAEPQVAFAVEGDWVSLALSRDDLPVANAQVQVYAATGHRFADGETGVDGRAAFPLPPGPDFRVEIKVGDRWADPIRLTPTGDHVVPTNVLLSFGLSPCCRIPARWGERPSVPPSTEAAPSSFGSLPLWAQAGGGVLFALVGAAILVLARRRPPLTRNHRRNPNDRPH